MTKEAETQSVQVIPNGLYTAREIQHHICRLEKRNVPMPTIRWRRNQLNITPDPSGLYNSSDLELMKKLSKALLQGKTVSQFLELRRQEIQNNAQ